MVDNGDPPDDLEERLDRLEATLEELREAVADDDQVQHGREVATPAAETALRLTERLAVPAAVAALEANVRVLEFVQERLREFEDRERSGGAAPETSSRVSERLLDRLEEAMVRLDDAIAEADLPPNADARRLLERARDLNEEVRDRVGSSGTDPSGPSVITIDVEEELEEIRDDVADEGHEEDPDEDEA